MNYFNMSPSIRNRLEGNPIQIMSKVSLVIAGLSANSLARIIGSLAESQTVFIYQYLEE